MVKLGACAYIDIRMDGFRASIISSGGGMGYEA